MIVQKSKAVVPIVMTTDGVLRILTHIKTRKYAVLSV